ncbi:hypothetical protein XH89_11555 [Bradyrhizobium sp. CCBAU 53340]|uniref:DUF6538 domain-containing protein n=1 Tax=Bradyrhizobium sp. CCBAU 53340 TaxID=1325112 RepID=UPI00188AFB5A|nr:DUF6538 domain-containing protein [Bradyrhizobium sp. CCBAU 53340]QOZ44048.1 hypothetical protein XH89_11555 [Bradyrhizobium sp. CCBAU 53340]
MSASDPDRYLLCLNGNYYYRRRVPTELRDVDVRGHTVKLSLKTSDIALARILRDLFERADDELWGSLMSGKDARSARRRYQATIQRAKAVGFLYNTTIAGRVKPPE